VRREEREDTERAEAEQLAELAALRKYLLRRAGWLTRSRHDAEDLVQAVFERLYQMGSPLPSAHALIALSQTILKRLAIDRSRHATRWRLSELSDEHSDASNAGPPEPGSSWQIISGQQLQAALQRCAAADREIFELHYAHGLRYSQIASQLGIAMGTVATRLHRARAQLRVELERLLSDGA
jgi:RNA polymerase sigma-70 factor (ECF subfamily)